MLDPKQYDDPTITARVTALETTPTPELKRLWRELFQKEAPPFNRRYLISRLAYRIQEIAFGGLRPETIVRLERIAEEHWGPIDGKTTARRKPGRDADRRPIVGTRLVREWQGVQHTVTVLVEGFEYQGRRYASLSAIARAIAGSRWNGWVFFGLKSSAAGQAAIVEAR